MPAKAPTDCELAFYWLTSILFILLLHLPVVLIVIFGGLSFMMNKTAVNDYVTLNNYVHDSQFQLKIILILLSIFPTICLIIIFIFYTVYQLCRWLHCACCRKHIFMYKIYNGIVIATESLFYCVFSRQYFDVIEQNANAFNSKHFGPRFKQVDLESFAYYNDMGNSLSGSRMMKQTSNETLTMLTPLDASLYHQILDATPQQQSIHSQEDNVHEDHHQQSLAPSSANDSGAHMILKESNVTDSFQTFE